MRVIRTFAAGPWWIPSPILANPNSGDRGCDESGADALEPYRRKRNFAATPEPRGAAAAEVDRRFVVQKHAARRLHYDLRLELDGARRAGPCTRGPSFGRPSSAWRCTPRITRSPTSPFEGVIPKGEYGGGTMIVWDCGRWEPEGDPRTRPTPGAASRSRCEGERLNGPLASGPHAPKPGEKREQWLLFKAERRVSRARPTTCTLSHEETTSVLSGP